MDYVQRKKMNAAIARYQRKVRKSAADSAQLVREHWGRRAAIVAAGGDPASVRLFPQRWPPSPSRGAASKVRKVAITPEVERAALDAIERLDKPEPLKPTPEVKSWR